MALGLHALQHRGQEAAGIVTYDGKDFHAHRAMGHVAGNFDRTRSIRKPDGRHRHRPQPLFDDRRDGAAQHPAAVCRLAVGGFAVAHNGNLSNAMTLRARAGAARLDFPVHHRHRGHHPPGRDQQLSAPLLDRLIDALKQVEGAYSLVCLTTEG